MKRFIMFILCAQAYSAQAADFEALNAAVSNLAESVNGLFNKYIDQVKLVATMNTEKIKMEQTIEKQKKDLEIDQNILDKYIGYLAEIQNDLFNFDTTVNLNSLQIQDLLTESNNPNDKHLRENLTALLEKREEQRLVYEQQQQEQQLQLQQYQLQLQQQQEQQLQQEQQQQQQQLQQQLKDKDAEIENLKNQLMNPLEKKSRLKLENEGLMRIIKENGLENKVKEAYPKREIKREMKREIKRAKRELPF